MALRVEFGGFSYFNGGDLTANSYDGALPWADIEGRAAEACGPVDVAVACHHGYYDAVGSRAVSALRPSAWIVQPWHLSHPDAKPLERMLSTRIYPRARRLFLTSVMPEAVRTNARFLKEAASLEGHVVIRTDGKHYAVCVTDNRDEADRVKLVIDAVAVSGRTGSGPGGNTLSSNGAK